MDFFEPHRKQCELVNGQIHHVFRCRSFVDTVVTNSNSVAMPRSHRNSIV